jgi:cyclic pyranopterin phosphate synthase
MASRPADELMRTVDTLRVSVTQRCNMSCIYCRDGAEGCAARGAPLSLGTVLSLCNLLRHRFGLRRVRITGGEPLLRPDILDWVRGMAELGVEVVITTNGQLLRPLAGPLKEAGLSRVNVSLDTLDEEKFRLMCGGELKATLGGIEAALASGLSPVKTNTVVLRGWNDRELPALARYCLERGVEARFLEVMSIGMARAHHPDWFVSAREILQTLQAEMRLRPLGRRQGQTARRFAVQGDAVQEHGMAGVIGVISPESAPFCGDCRRLRLSSDGRLFGCLMDDEGVAMPRLRGNARDAAALEDCINTALSRKMGIRGRRRHRSVVEIGG